MIRVFTTCAACLLFIWGGISPTWSAPLAEDHIVLYYLIEMQRQHGNPCPGDTKRQLPSIVASENLRGMAQEGGAGTADMDMLIKKAGLAGAPVFYTSVTGTPQQALNEMIAQQCQSLMSPQYVYVGAAREKGAWMVVMSGKQPAPVVAAQPVPVPQSTAVSQPDPQMPREGVTPLPDPNPAPIVVENNLPGHGYTFEKENSTAATGFQAGDNDPRAPAPPQVTGHVSYPSGFAVVLPQSQQTQPPAYEPLPAASGGYPEADKLVAYINKIRTEGRTCGGMSMRAQPVRNNPLIAAVAKRHTRDMAVRNYFSSTSPEGEQPGNRLERAGFMWSLVAENIASGQSMEEAVDVWLGNEAQCKNIMNPLLSDAGAGFDSSSGLWVLLLAAPMAMPEVYPQKK